MQDEHNPEPAAAGAAQREPEEHDWVSASGVSGEHVLAGERAPRLHWVLMILGPIGLAIAIMLSLWSSSRQVERSVNIQIETTWTPGEQLAVRTQILDGQLRPLEPETAVSVAVEDAEGQRHELAALEIVGSGVSQGSFTVPELALGESELIVHYEPAVETGLEPFDERLPIIVVREREQDQGRQVIAGHILQWADDTDPQPADVRIDLRPAERLLAGFDNELFVRVTDAAGKPWKPKPPPPKEGAEPLTEVPAKVQVLLISGEFAGELGKSEQPPVLYEGPLDELGLARFSGELRSDVVRFEVRLIGEAELAALLPATPPVEGQPPAQPPVEGQQPAQPPAEAPKYFTGPKRKLRFVSHSGTVRIRSSTNFARPGDAVTVSIEAISARKPAFVDVHGPDGAWIDTFTPPMQVPQEREWTIPANFPVGRGAGAGKAGAVIQFEAYQSTLRPEDSSALARVQVVPPNITPAASIAELIERQRQQLSLPRVDKQFEIGRERAYLSEIEARAARLDPASVDLTRAFLLGSLEAVVHGPTQALNTRAREDEALTEFKHRWVMRIRWGLLGGGGLFILTMALMLWRNQRTLERQTSRALGFELARGAAPPPGDDEVFADQSLAIMRARRQVLARGAFMIVLAIAALIMTVAMLESMVWKY